MPQGCGSIKAVSSLVGVGKEVLGCVRPKNIMVSFRCQETRCPARTGTYDEPNCMYKAKDLDHAVAVVGYATDDAGKDYWIVKNSWSSHW